MARHGQRHTGSFGVSTLINQSTEEISHSQPWTFRFSVASPLAMPKEGNTRGDCLILLRLIEMVEECEHWIPDVKVCLHLTGKGDDHIYSLLAIRCWRGCWDTIFTFGHFHNIHIKLTRDINGIGISNVSLLCSTWGVTSRVLTRLCGLFPTRPFWHLILHRLWQTIIRNTFISLSLESLLFTWASYVNV